MSIKLSNAVSEAPTPVLVQTVKLIQKKAGKGCKGAWKDFLKSHDPKLGSSLSDPAKRSRETLISFLSTFTDPDDVKFITRVIKAQCNRVAIESILQRSENEPSEKSLIRLTLKHPLYRSHYIFPYDKEWVIKRASRKRLANGPIELLGIDCEMVLCDDGLDALVRVCVVDCNLQVKLDALVNPCKTVIDYRTEITGVCARDLDNTSCNLATVQKKLRKLITKQTVLIGHSLYNDLLALKFDCAMVIDTSYIFKTIDGSTPSLNSLCKRLLGYQLRQEGCPHDCQEDAKAVMKLVRYTIEQGLSEDIPLIEREVKHLSESDLSKLFIHRVPVELPIDELRCIFHETIAVEIKLQKNSRAVYSAHALFSNPKEAQEAFEAVKGEVEKDKVGLLQKLVTFKRKTGSYISLYVRKMSHEPDTRTSEQIQETKKRAVDDDIGSVRVKMFRKVKDVDIASNNRKIKVKN